MKTILVVEDDIGQVVADSLELMGYFPILMKNGIDAIKSIEEGLIYDFAIVDYSLPYKDGLEVIKASKRLNPDVKAMIFSSYPVNLNSTGADGVIRKSADEFFEDVKFYIGKP